MIDGRTVLGLIPARGGSKAVPRKNLRVLGGKPLIAWTIAAGQASQHVDRLILSSDDNEIISVATSFGCEAPFVRPAEFSTDAARSIDVAHHALRSLSTQYDYLVLLQPTSPLRLAVDIDTALQRCHVAGASSCVSVRPVGDHPAWMFEIGRDGTLVPFAPGPRPPRRQDLSPLHALNGAIYVARCEWLMQQQGFIGPDTQALEMPAARSADIDSEIDFVVAEALLKVTTRGTA